MNGDEDDEVLRDDGTEDVVRFDRKSLRSNTARDG
jgi:hypothetical protein